MPLSYLHLSDARIVQRYFMGDGKVVTNAISPTCQLSLFLSGYMGCLLLCCIGIYMTDQEINEAVARKLGWIDIEPSTNPLLFYGHRQINDELELVPDYCHSIAAAWEVVEHLQKEFIIYVFGGMPNSVWHCDIQDHPTAHLGRIVSQSADTAPMAICLTFLKLP